MFGINNSSAIFSEKQKFDQWWIWLIFIGTNSILLFGAYQQLILGESFGDKPMSDTGLILSLILSLGITLLFVMLSLETVITKQSISFNFKPFSRNNILLKNIDSVKLVNYGFVGSGIRMGTKYGTIYKIKGQTGLAIVLKNGKKYCIGTQKEDEMLAALKQIVPILKS